MIVQEGTRQSTQFIIHLAIQEIFERKRRDLEEKNKKMNEMAQKRTELLQKRVEAQRR